MKKSIKDLGDIKGKRALVRVDINVPLDENNNVSDDTRIQAIIPTVKYLTDKGAKVILMAHLGRPKGEVKPEFSLEPVAKYLSKVLGQDVLFVKSLVGQGADKELEALKDGQVALLENIRFYKAEEAKDDDMTFANELAKLGDFYVNDAFGAAHRKHTSTAKLAKILKPAVSGLLMEKELRCLGSALDNPQHPFTAIVGGAKVSTKIGVLENLIEKVDNLIIGGGMAYTFVKANGGKIVYKFTFPVTVTYQNASNLYVKDAEGGAMLIYGNQVPKYEVGDVIPAGIMGEYTNFSGLPEMQYPVAESFADATQNVPTYPIAMKAGEITLSDLNKVVVVTGNVDETGKVVTDATGSLALYYQKAWNVETPAAGEYDVVCAVAVYKTDLQAYPISFNEPGSGVDDAVAAATTVVATANGIVINAAEACTVVVYNAAGQAVETVNVAAGESTVNVPAGFYIVKAANTVCKVLVK